MNTLPVALRPMQKDDITNAMKLSGAEGWNQTEKDWKLLNATIHKMLPSFSIIGISPDIIEIAKKIQNYSKLFRPLLIFNF